MLAPFCLCCDRILGPSFLDVDLAGNRGSGGNRYELSADLKMEFAHAFKLGNGQTKRQPREARHSGYPPIFIQCKAEFEDETQNAIYCDQNSHRKKNMRAACDPSVAIVVVLILPLSAVPPQSL